MYFNCFILFYVPHDTLSGWQCVPSTTHGKEPIYVGETDWDKKRCFLYEGCSCLGASAS